MKPISRHNINDEELEKQLTTKLIVTIGLILGIAFAIIFFAPAFGSIFKIFAKKGSGSDLVIKPSTPMIIQLPNATKEGRIKITGYAQEGHTVKLFVNGPEKGSTVVGSDGMFVFSDIELIRGRNTIFAKAIDTKGNESDPTSTYMITLDLDAPKIEIETPKNDSTVRNLDKRVTIKGKLNEKANVTVNDQIAIVNSDLTFEHVLGVNEGSVTIKIKATDEAGNQKEEILNIKYQKSSN
jgi:hypothetical protein